MLCNQIYFINLYAACNYHLSGENVYCFLLTSSDQIRSLYFHSLIPCLRSV